MSITAGILGALLVVAVVVIVVLVLAGRKAFTTRVALEREREALTAERDRAMGERDTALASLEAMTARERESAGRVVELSLDLKEARTRLESADQRIRDLMKDEQRLRDAFSALSAETIKKSQETLGSYLEARLKDADEKSAMAHKQRAEAVESLVKPIAETLGKTREQLTQLDERVRASGESNVALREETARLAKALARPEVRGQYGEIQLKRVAELAGMTSYCDFSEQFSSRDGDGQLLRPDMVVTLPNDRVIVVDAKANINAYIDAVNEVDDEKREAHMERFARHTSDQVKKLSEKRYWSLFDGRSAEFVVMFVPGDQFIDAALARRPELLEEAAARGVILASPSTLIGLLRAVAVGWREHALTEEAAALFELGKELHDRAATAFEHAGKLGDSIRQSVERYNRLVGSIDSRLVPTLRKFEDAGAKSAKALEEPKRVEGVPRALDAGEQLELGRGDS
jgi:DNA recombination protein RmuC